MKNDTQTEVVIIDIETAGTTEDCVIFTIGAVRFNPSAPHAPTVEHLRDTGFYTYVAAPKQILNGRKLDRETTEVWWPKQSVKAQAEMQEAYGENAVELDVALAALAEYVRPDDRVYARGQDFEYKFLSHAYKMVHKRFFRYHNKIFDVRTWIEAHTSSNSGIYQLQAAEHLGLTAHVAIDDCIRDALEMYFCRKEFIANTMARPENIQLVINAIDEVREEQKIPKGKSNEGE